MGNRLTLKDKKLEKQLFQRRLLIAMFLMLILAAILICRLFYLQVIQHELYTTLSQKNQLTLLPIAPNRGLIYDRKGILIAQNVPVFSLEIIPDKIKNLKKTIAELQTIIPISNDDLKSFYKQLKQHRQFDTVSLRLKLNEDELARFYVNQYRFPGVVVGAQMIRYYPLGANMVDVLGYVGRINEQDLTTIDPVNYSGTNFIGKLGIEKSYESVLHGTVGYQQVETDASGRIVRVLKRTPPVSGKNLYLTIDSGLQQAAMQALGQNNGAAVVINPQNGEVLALASNPAYDPNLFVQGIQNTVYQILQKDPNNPLNNRAIRGLYPPGSTIKPFLALEGLSSGVITPTFQIHDPGYFMLPNSSHVYRDWKKGGHGTVNVSKAITVSCDTFFYTIGVKMGIMRINYIMSDFGFGKPTGLDVDEEIGGLIPNPEWKRRTKNEPWYLGDTVVSSIGQGYNLVTPLQQANGVAQIAMRGKGYRPHLVQKMIDANDDVTLIQPQALPVINVDPPTWDLVVTAMVNVLKPGGTSAIIGNAPYSIAGKSGTAQVFSTHGVIADKNADLAKHLRDNTLFIAFAPVDNPQIAIAVVVENSMDAKITTRKIMDYYFEGTPIQDTPTQGTPVQGAPIQGTPIQGTPRQ
ncbi:MAG: penicillin-binding protein 2 [Gammaproteobacteria bacterium]|nr:penicillin-binding protein 2 [Gammaproteobacteria bacterium]